MRIVIFSSSHYLMDHSNNKKLLNSSNISAYSSSSFKFWELPIYDWSKYPVIDVKMPQQRYFQTKISAINENHAEKIV